MVSKKTIYFKITLLFGILTVVLLTQLIFIPTVTRFRQEENDEIRAYYTALYLNHDGEGKVVALEEKVVESAIVGYSGTLSLNVMNFIGEDITQRDIDYKIYTKEIMGNDTDGYYVQGIWNQKIEVEPATKNYTINIMGEGETEETATMHSLKCSITEDNSNAVGTTNSHMIQITKNNNDWENPQEQVEKMSIIIEVNEPYRDVFVIDIIVSTKLIVFSTAKISKMGCDVQRVYIQTASSFKQINYEEKTGYESDAFRVTLHWDGYLLDNTFEKILKHATYGSFDPRKINEVYLDTSHLQDGKSITTDHTIVLYIPANSDFYIDFYDFDSMASSFQVLAYMELKKYAESSYTEYEEYEYTISAEGPVNGESTLNYYIIHSII